jgi:hypothetical protein
VQSAGRSSRSFIFFYAAFNFPSHFLMMKPLAQPFLSLPMCLRQQVFFGQKRVVIDTTEVRTWVNRRGTDPQLLFCLQSRRSALSVCVCGRQRDVHVAT